MAKMLISNEIRNDLLTDRKKLLINLTRILRNMLRNGKLFKEVVGMMESFKIYTKLQCFSDCTNFVFERELY